MRAWRTELPLLATIFLDLLGFGMILADIQLRAQGLIPTQWGAGAIIGALLALTFVVQTVVSPLWGRISDRVGRKPVIVVCTLLSAAAMLVYGFASSLAFLFLSRFLAGLGGANVAVAQALIADVREDAERTAALGRASAAVSLGLIVGPPLGGLVAHEYGSHLLGIGAAIVSAIGAFAILLVPAAAVSSAAEAEGASKVKFRLLHEKPELRRLVLVAVIAWFSLATLEGTFARLIHQMLGYDQREFGFLFGYEALVALVVQGSLLAWLTHRFRERRLLKVSYLFQGAGLALNPAAAPLHAIVPGIVTLGVASTLYALGVSVANPTVNGIASRLTPSARQGELFGLLQGARSVGFVVGPILGGALFDLWAPGPYLLAGVVCVAAAVLVKDTPSEEAS